MRKKVLAICSLMLLFSSVMIPNTYASLEQLSESKKVNLASATTTTVSNNNTAANSISSTSGQFAKYEKMLNGKKIKKEIISKRELNEKQFELEDGSLVEVVSSHDIHFIDAQGKLAEIDPRITKTDVLPDNQSQASKANSTGNMKKTVPSFKTKSLPFNLSIPSDFLEGYSIGSQDAKLKFIPVGARSSIGQWNEAAQTKVSYTNVWPSTNVELEATDWGIKESIILKDGKSPTRFTFEVMGQLDQELNGKKATLLPAWLKDATGKMIDVEQTLRTENDKKFLDMSFDPTSLTYPILIDPSVYEQEEEFYDSGSFEVNLDPTKTVGSTDIFIRPLLESLFDFHLTAGTIEFYSYSLEPGLEYHAVGGVNSLSLPYYNIVDFYYNLGNRMTGPVGSSFGFGSRGQIYVVVTYLDANPPDTTPPTTPTNLAVTRNELHWTASSDNIGVAGYEIYNGTERIGSSGRNTYILAGLSSNTVYNLTVKARDAAGNVSGASNTVTYMIDTQRPTAPANLVVKPHSPTSVTLQWTASTDNVGVTGYNIYSYSGSTLVGESSTNTYTVTGLNPNASYNFSVKAKDMAGNLSPESNVVSARPYMEVAYHYDESNRLDFIVLSTGEILDYTYDANGNLIRIQKTTP
ncbi:fibronectin type III domain-containing protein [Paenibacillus sepulcri]|uniref:Fibronectin type III domain-containing protein n=1 Tax=Paenibacillus sepulcri TaxID=359917 RepID=A0ABS7BWL9_9BACL|nr:fibronectin type III domain-containing protein [Paenibacillus sepulcri]